MKRIWTIIGVSDVPSSFRWYQSLFGQPETRPGHADFGQILDSDGTVLLCLHQWGAHEHPSLMSRDEATPGNGLLLFFRVDDFDLSLNRARTLVARLEEEPHTNPHTRTREFSLRDPNGYYVTIGEISALARIAGFVSNQQGGRLDTPLFSRIDTIILRVRDHAAAVAWYEEQLGLTATFTDPAERLSVLDIGEGSSLTLWELRPDEREPARDGAGTFPIFATSDAVAAHRRLAESGVRVSEVSESPGVRFFTFWDLDGNRLEACEVEDRAA